MTPARGQHYVWAYYLTAWAPDGRLWCRRNGKIFPCSPEGVGKQRDFYKVREMSPKDLSWLRTFCDQQMPPVRAYAHTIVDDFNELFMIAQRLRAAGADPAEVDSCIDRLSIDLEEKHVQGVMEHAGKTSLDALKAGDIAFFQKPAERLIFLQFLCTQYARTKRMRDGATTGPGRMVSHNPENIWGPLCHIVAAALSASLVRDDFGLYILRNRTGISLLTADQPAINLHATGLAPEDLVDSFTLYYPVSPTVAALVSLLPPDDSDMTPEDVTHYNAHMVAQSHEMVFASTRSSLDALASAVPVVPAFSSSA